MKAKQDKIGHLTSVHDFDTKLSQLGVTGQTMYCSEGILIILRCVCLAIIQQATSPRKDVLALEHVSSAS